MIPQRIYITITQEHIDKAVGLQKSRKYVARKCCPTAQALVSKGYEYVNVGGNYFMVGQSPGNHRPVTLVTFIPSRRLKNFILNFDKQEPITPGRFICKREVLEENKP